MKTLNLHKIWQICNKLSEKMKELSESSKYIYLLGNGSNYSESSFEGFLEYYSFRVENGNIVVFNSDPVPYEHYSNEDFSYVPTVLLDFSEKEFEQWVETEINKQLKEQELRKLADKERIKEKIERLQKQLNE